MWTTCLTGVGAQYSSEDDFEWRVFLAALVSIGMDEYDIARWELMRDKYQQALRRTA